MKSIEERLWDYIDETCSTDERAVIEGLIAKNDEWNEKHRELTAFNNEINAIETDEPPMGFAFKVMEQIRAEEARTPLKTSVNKYLIKGIAAFFIVTITAILVIVLSDTSLLGNAALDINIHGMDIFNGTAVVKTFAYLDIMLLLFFADTLLRKKFGQVDA